MTATSDLHFTPDSVHITLRNSANPTAHVTWNFESTAHNVTWDARPQGAEVFNIETTSNGHVSRSFHVAGTYTYHCSIHPSMTGKITVI